MDSQSKTIRHRLAKTQTAPRKKIRDSMVPVRPPDQFCGVAGFFCHYEHCKKKFERKSDGITHHAICLWGPIRISDNLKKGFIELPLPKTTTKRFQCAREDCSKLLKSKLSVLYHVETHSKKDTVGVRSKALAIGGNEEEVIRGIIYKNDERELQLKLVKTAVNATISAVKPGQDQEETNYVCLRKRVRNTIETISSNNDEPQPKVKKDICLLKSNDQQSEITNKEEETPYAKEICPTRARTIDTKIQQQQQPDNEHPDIIGNNNISNGSHTHTGNRTNKVLSTLCSTATVAQIVHGIRS